MKANWQPLEELLGAERCVGFMFMGRANGINLYKHGIARISLNLDDRGRCWVLNAGRYEKADLDAELVKLEALLARMGETLESIYDEAYIARKTEALRKAGISLIRIRTEPENLSIN